MVASSSSGSEMCDHEAEPPAAPRLVPGACLVNSSSLKQCSEGLAPRPLTPDPLPGPPAGVFAAQTFPGYSVGHTVLFPY